MVENAFANMVDASATRIRHAAANIEESLNEIPASERGPRDRVASNAAYYRAMYEGLKTTAKSLRQRD